MQSACDLMNYNQKDALLCEACPKILSNSLLINEETLPSSLPVGTPEADDTTKRPMIRKVFMSLLLIPDWRQCCYIWGVNGAFEERRRRGKG